MSHPMQCWSCLNTIEDDTYWRFQLSERDTADYRVRGSQLRAVLCFNCAIDAERQLMRRRIARSEAKR